MKKSETNVKKLVRFMEYAESGPLMQGFIMSAIIEKAEFVVEYYEKHPEELDDSNFVNPRAWLACAKEICDTWRKYDSNY